MKSAAQLVPSLRQVFRVQALAGPSTRPALARAASTVAETPDESLPPNVHFEDLAGARTQVGDALLARGQCLHSKPADHLEPIMHPLSSLASTKPTDPIRPTKVVPLPQDIFGKPIRKDILHRNVVWYLSTLRAGNQHSKTRKTVAYSGKKIMPQKGTGKARVGDRSSGIRRGGAPIHPLVNRDWAQALPRKVRKLGLETALSSKLSTGLMRIVENLDEAGWLGTNDAARALGDGTGLDLESKEFIERFGPKKDLSILFLYSPSKDPEEVEKFHRKIRNLPNVELLPTDQVLAYHILKYRWLVMEADAINAFDGDDMLYNLDPAFEAELQAALEAEAAQVKATPEPVKTIDLNAQA